MENYMNREVVKALLYFPDNNIQSNSYLLDYINVTDFRCIMMDFENMLIKTKLTKNDMLFIKYIQQGATHEEIADVLKVSRSAVSHRLKNLVNKICKANNIA